MSPPAVSLGPAGSVVPTVSLARAGSVVPAVGRAPAASLLPAAGSARAGSVLPAAGLARARSVLPAVGPAPTPTGAPCITQQTSHTPGGLGDISIVAMLMCQRGVVGGGLWRVMHGACGEKRRRAPRVRAFRLSRPHYSCAT